MLVKNEPLELPESERVVAENTAEQLELVLSAPKTSISPINTPTSSISGSSIIRSLSIPSTAIEPLGAASVRLVS